MILKEPIIFSQQSFQSNSSDICRLSELRLYGEGRGQSQGGLGFGLGAIPGSAHELLLAQCSGITSDNAWGPCEILVI